MVVRVVSFLELFLSPRLELQEPDSLDDGCRLARRMVSEQTAAVEEAEETVDRLLGGYGVEKLT